MSEIDDLISKTITPIGIQKKNRRSIFKTIGEVGEKIKEDALKAFNAHFPYLADEKKLEEHGTALLIPHLLHDGDEEFRNRVAAASFFLSKAGERGYILSQLEAHFGGRYVLSESFLNVYVKVLDISESDRQWVRQFLDELLNPVIRLTFGDWMKYIEHLPFTDKDEKCVKRIEAEHFASNQVFRNGMVLRDGHTILPTCYLRLFRDGSAKRDGTVQTRSKKRQGASIGHVFVPIQRSSNLIDQLTRICINRVLSDRWQNQKTSDVSVLDILKVGMRYHYIRNKMRTRNGSIKRMGGNLIAV